MKSGFTPKAARWMLVDDDVDFRGTAAQLLVTLGGVEVASYPSGASALNAFEAAPDAFELVVSDLDMPGKSGIELCLRLKMCRPALRVLLATGSGVITPAEARHYGFCGLVAKPFSMAALRDALAQVASLEH